MRSAYILNVRKEDKEEVRQKAEQDHPLRFTLISTLAKIQESLQGSVEEQVSDFRKNLVSITESFSFTEIAERAGLPYKEEYKEVQKLKEECSARMKKLLNLERELEPKENFELAYECGTLEKKAEELKQKGFMEAIDGSILALRDSFIQLVASKIEATYEYKKSNLPSQ